VGWVAAISVAGDALLDCARATFDENTMSARIIMIFPALVSSGEGEPPLA
jgi:hypothetical protein